MATINLLNLSARETHTLEVTSGREYTVTLDSQYANYLTLNIRDQNGSSINGNKIEGLNNDYFIFTSLNTGL